MKVSELFEGDSEKLSKEKAWIKKMYEKYPKNPINPAQRVMVWGEGDDQTFAMFELSTSFSRKDGVEVKWFQAYPLRQGVGTKAMRELQKEAQRDGIVLTLFPWDRGVISQAKLIKFYKSMGFKPTSKGSKNMYWEPPASTDLKEEVTDDVREKYQRWKKLVNMPTPTLKKFLDTETGKDAGLKKSEASKLGIGTGRESARAILRMREKPLSQWDKTDISWMGRQLSFIARMSGNAGPLVQKDKDGKNIPTRKLTSLWVWGHVPAGYPPGKFGVFS